MQGEEERWQFWLGGILVWYVCGNHPVRPFFINDLLLSNYSFLGHWVISIGRPSRIMTILLFQWWSPITTYYPIQTTLLRSPQYTSGCLPSRRRSPLSLISMNSRRSHKEYRTLLIVGLQEWSLQPMRNSERYQTPLIQHPLLAQQISTQVDLQRLVPKRIMIYVTNRSQVFRVWPRCQYRLC